MLQSSAYQCRTIYNTLDRRKIKFSKFSYQNYFMSIHAVVFELLTKQWGPHNIKLSISVFFASLSSKSSAVNFAIISIEGKRDLSYLYNIGLWVCQMKYSAHEPDIVMSTCLLLHFFTWMQWFLHHNYTKINAQFPKSQLTKNINQSLLAILSMGWLFGGLPFLLLSITTYPVYTSWKLNW